MKIAVLGDTHGRDLWKQVEADKIIFLGDYFDSFDIKFADQYNNFYDIIEYKKKRKDEVILLLGNHDYHYMSWADQSYSGYQTKHGFVIQKAFVDNLEHFQVGYQHDVQVDHQLDKFLFTHAGVTNTWWKNITDEPFSVDLLNDFLIYKPTVFGFAYNPKPHRMNSTNPYGDNIFQGPMWVRPDSLVKDSLKEYVHIVGHTHHDKMTIKENCIFIDTLEHKKYLLFNDSIIEEVCL